MRSHRTPAAGVPNVPIELVRGLPFTYEVDVFSPAGVKSTVSPSSSPQGALLRGHVVEVQLPPSVNPPVDPLAPETWNRS